MLASKGHACGKPVWQRDRERIRVLAWLKWRAIREFQVSEVLLDDFESACVVLLDVSCLVISSPRMTFAEEGVLMTHEFDCELCRGEELPLQVDMDLASEGGPCSAGLLIASQLNVYLPSVEFYTIRVR